VEGGMKVELRGLRGGGRRSEMLTGMELSIFLAKLFGVYLLTMAVLLAVRGAVISQVIEEFFANRALLFLSGVLALVIGIAMAVGHSVWEANWRGLITLVGYLAIAKGVARISFPEVPQQVAGRFVKSGAGRWIWSGFLALLGGYLTWAGFAHG